MNRRSLLSGFLASAVLGVISSIPILRREEPIVKAAEVIAYRIKQISGTRMGWQCFTLYESCPEGRNYHIDGFMRGRRRLNGNEIVRPDDFVVLKRNDLPSNETLDYAQERIYFDGDLYNEA